MGSHDEGARFALLPCQFTAAGRIERTVKQGVRTVEILGCYYVGEIDVLIVITASARREVTLQKSRAIKAMHREAIISGAKR
jgi:hypothetical protein